MTESTAPVYCYNHPGVETSLRCYRCGRPICAKCARRTPTGYLCPECVRGQQKIFDTAVWYDYLLGFAVAAGLGAIASLLVTLIGGIGIYGILIIIIGAPTIGMVIAEGVRLVTRKHRSRALFLTVAAGVVLGALPVILVQVLLSRGGFFSLIYQALFLILTVPVVFTRLSGIRLTR
jgi:hypothetical protein